VSDVVTVSDPVALIDGVDEEDGVCVSEALLVWV